MKLEILTIVLDGQPFISKILPELKKLKVPWFWRIAEGASDNTHCTKWCNKPIPRLSRDGTSEYLSSISGHPNIKIYRRQIWDGKVSMFNAMCSDINSPCVLLERDVDEFYTAHQMERIVKMFEDRPEAMRAYFWCRYFLGPKIISTSVNGYGNRNGEWLRAFRFKPGMTFSKHEPPILNDNNGIAISREETADLGIIFDHFSWLLETQAIFKESFYGYKNAAMHWRNLQKNTKWPVSGKKFLPWVGDGATFDLINEAAEHSWKKILEMEGSL